MNFIETNAKLQLFVNIIYILMTAIAGVISQMAMLNLTQGSIEVIGWAVHMLTELILPLCIFIFTNRNAPKVILSSMLSNVNMACIKILQN